MLYVFHVDTGTMLTFDMNLAMESVATLQGVIARACHITEDKQVLLISGGESLEPSARVGKYHAGTDTNPIFLFSKSTIEAMTPPSPSVHYGSDVDIHSQVEGSLLLPPAYATVVSRAQLALQIHDVDKEEMKACEKLVHDQHLQQQGWAAVVANLEDITSALRQRSEIFITAYQDYLGQRDGYKETLSSVISSLQLLSKIPILPVLLGDVSFLAEQSIGLVGSDEESNRSLYDWISSQDPQHNLNDMVDQCVKATEQLDPRIQDSLSGEVQNTLTQVDNDSMKEVKGLEDRLYGLDQMMSTARKLVQEQSDMSQGFVQNQNRVSNLRDKSILPDLCSSHKRQLLVMVNNHKLLRDKKKKCKMAKEELAVNLHTRLRWVMWVEKMICDVDGKLMIYHENLKRLRKRLDILRQIYEAPRVYAQLVVEVVRRRKFASFFTKWATTLADDFNSVHSEEVKRRQSFHSEVGHHFLQTLFQGFEDVPVTVINKVPSDFDKNLPNITSDDITMLKDAVPELAAELRVPMEAALPVGTTDITKSKFPQLFKYHSMVTSEIEIIHSLDEQYLTAERDSVSLGEQVANSELDTDLVIKSDSETVQLKPEILMPRSLSEDLTQQMKGEGSDDSKDDNVKGATGITGASASSPVKSEQVTLKSSAEASGASTSSGEQIKSSGSDSSGQDNTHHSAEYKAKRVGRKILAPRRTGAEFSPDMETSQEFTTADFYIEDSMPSSISDSPPSRSKPSTEKPSSEKLLENKAAYLERLEKENVEFKAKYSVVASKLKTFEEYVNIHLPEMKSSLNLFQSTYTSNKIEFHDEFESSKQKILEALQHFDSQRSDEEKVNMDKVLADAEKSKKVLEEKLLKSDAHMLELKEEVDNLQRDLVIAKEDVAIGKQTWETKIQDFETQILEMKKMAECDKCKIVELENQKESLEKQSKETEQRANETKEKLNSDLSEAKQNYDVEVSELTKQHSLVLEVELDKLGAELKVQSDELEKTLSEKELLLADTEQKLGKSAKENIILEEKMMEKFQIEKDEITKIMEEHFEERLKNKLDEQKETLTEVFVHEKETLLNEHKSTVETLSKQLLSEKENETKTFRQELEDKFQKSEAELRESLQKEKDVDLKKLRDVLTEDYQKEMGIVREELLKEKATLVSELRSYRDKVVQQRESQTEELECNPQSVQTDTTQVTGQETQTSIHEVTQTQSQTDKTEQSQQQIQTEVFPGTHTESQTEVKEVKTGVSQTKTISLSQGETQTKTISLSQGETQTKTICLSQGETQTKTICLSPGETQTTIKEYRPEEAQTKVTSFTQGEAQTDLKAMEQHEASAEGSKVIGNVLSREEHEQAVKEMEIQLRQQKEEAVEKAVTDTRERMKGSLNALQEQHDQEISELIAKLERDRDESVSSLKTSMTADKQVMFNEAVSKVSQEKDKVIEGHRQKEADLLQQQQNNKDTIDKLKEDKAKVEDMKNRAISHLHDKEREFAALKRQMESDVALAHQQLTEYQTQLMPASHMTVSTSPSVMNISTTEDKECRITELEEAMKTKDDEITNLHQKLSELSMTASTRSVVQDKVSITSCSVGDLVLFCLDERHDQYVVFTIGTTLHFLHTDCLEGLGLRTYPGEARKSWVLAEITEKEYCQAKKPLNRFKVPVGTKFYRVKAKQWNREVPETGAVGGAPKAQLSS